MTEQATESDAVETQAEETDQTPAEVVERTFSQTDLDRIVQDRLARQKAQFADYADLKEKASRLAEIEAENQTELEKAQNRASDLERQMAETSERAQKMRVDSAILAEAVKHGVDTDIAVAMLDRSNLELDDDGTPLNIADAMEALLKAKPHLAGGGQARAASADMGARSGAPQLTRDQVAHLSDAEFEKALADGGLNSLLGG